MLLASQTMVDAADTCSFTYEEFFSSACDTAQETVSFNKEIGECYEYSSTGPVYAKIWCNELAAGFALYTDAGCTTLKTERSVKAGEPNLCMKYEEDVPPTYMKFTNFVFSGATPVTPDTPADDGCKVNWWNAWTILMCQTWFFGLCKGI